MRIQIEKSQIEITPTWHNFGGIRNWFRQNLKLKGQLMIWKTTMQAKVPSCPFHCFSLFPNVFCFIYEVVQEWRIFHGLRTIALFLNNSSIDKVALLDLHKLLLKGSQFSTLEVHKMKDFHVGQKVELMEGWKDHFF